MGNLATRRVPRAAGVIDAVLNRLRRPEVSGFADDDPALAPVHARIIRTDPALHRLYALHYVMLRRALSGIPAGPVVELGSGGGFLKDVMPGVVTSDVVPLSGVDQVIASAALPFEPASVAGLVLLNVFHHVPDPAAFLREADRVLVPGGRVAMIEPAHTMLWSRLYRACSPEPYDASSGWGFPASGRLTGANVPQAWIVFRRDRDRYAREFPRLPVKSTSRHTCLGLLAAGGLRYRGPLPGALAPLLPVLEAACTPLRPFAASQMTVVLEKSYDG